MCAIPKGGVGAQPQSMSATNGYQGVSWAKQTNNSNEDSLFWYY